MSKFTGFPEPEQNWSKLPHILIDELPNIKTLSALKIILYVLRHTYGYHDDYKKITIDEFCNGRKRKDGSRIDGGTGLSKPSVVSGIKDAIAGGYLFQHIDKSDAARNRKYYSLNEQVLKIFTPDFKVGVKNLYTGGKESLHRTEKETLERNFTNAELTEVNSSVGETDTSQDLFDSLPSETTRYKSTKPEASRTTDAPASYLADVLKYSEKELQELGADDTALAFLGSGWSIQRGYKGVPSKSLKKAICEFSRQTGFSIPKSDGQRSFWRKTIVEQVIEFGLDNLANLYQKAYAKAIEQDWSVSGPASLTKTMLALHNQVNKPAIDLSDKKVNYRF